MRSTPVLLVLGLTVGSCSPELGVPDGYCENDCKENWTPNCERDCDIPNPNTGGGGAGDGMSGIGGSGQGGRSGIGGTMAGAGSSGGAGIDAGGAGGARPDAGAGSGGDGAGSDGGGNCDETDSPLDEPCVIADELAVFVSPEGEDDADGTMADPVSLRSAVDKAEASGIERILLCTGSYGQRLVIDDVDSVIEVYGGFDCSQAQWEASSSGGTTVEPSSGVALRVKSMVKRVRIENVAFEAADATEDGASSIAAILETNTEVALEDVALKAGKGKNAEDADETDPFEFPMKTACADENECLEGKDAAGTVRGGEREFECPAGGSENVTVGGRGGDSGAVPKDGDDGTPDLEMGAGGSAAMGVDLCEPGQVGGAGVDGSDGPGADSVGSIVSSVWTPASGETAEHGHVGQGGGGGGATDAGGGGGGGAGGCGGKAGIGGQGGGSSIALLSITNTVVALTNCMLTADDAGDGGDGAAGQVGMSTGGIPGNGDSGGCPGGTGGAGGDGGAGGGGAGGVSVGIVYKGDAPTRSNSPATTGDFGIGGQGPGTDNDGIDGIAANTIEVD